MNRGMQWHTSNLEIAVGQPFIPPWTIYLSGRRVSSYADFRVLLN
ncbi:hypothetical protein DO62_5663 [Burkholderia pseudomallei]|nr:hypothetical protein DO62_5663 [Burkholderia pseudomallei]